MLKQKTSGEVVMIGAVQGEFIEKDTVLCSLGVVELNRTEVKAPFSGFIEEIVKPGNFFGKRSGVFNHNTTGSNICSCRSARI